MTSHITHEGIKELVLEAGTHKKELKDISYSDDFFDFGYTSIAIVNLIELLESTYGIFIEPDKNIKRLNSVDNIYNILIERTSLQSNSHYS